MALNEPLSNRADSSPPPFVSCPYHLLKIRVEGRQRPQPAHHEPVHLPEVTEDQQILPQCVERLSLAKCSS